MTTVQAIRTFFFYLLLSSSAFVWGTLSFFIAPFLPFRARYRFVVWRWCRFATWLAKTVAVCAMKCTGWITSLQSPA